MQAKLREKLERMAGGRDSLAGWRRVLGADFDEVRPLLAAVTGERAGTYPCPVSGVSLMVQERIDGGGYVAFAAGDDAGTDDEDLALGWDDVQALELESVRLGEGVTEDRRLKAEDSGQRTETGNGDRGARIDDGKETDAKEHGGFAGLPVAKTERDFRMIRLPSGGVLDLTRKPKRRRFLMYAWEQSVKAGARNIAYETLRENYTEQNGEKSGVKCDRMRDDLFKGQVREFGELLELIGTVEEQKYRWLVRME